MIGRWALSGRTRGQLASVLARRGCILGTGGTAMSIDLKPFRCINFSDFHKYHKRYYRPLETEPAIDVIKVRNAWVEFSQQIQEYFRVGEVSRVFYEFAAICQKFGKVNDKVLWTQMLKASVFIGSAAKAKMFLREMREHGCKPDVVSYSVIIDLFSKLENWAEVDQYFTEMKSNAIRPNETTYSTLLLNINILQVDSSTGLKYLNQMIEEQFPFNEELNTRSLDILYRAEDLNQLLRYLSLYPSYLGSKVLVSFYGKINEMFKARELFDSLKSQQNNTQDMDLYNRMLKCYTDKGLADEAVTFFEEIMKISSTPHPDICNTMLSFFTHTNTIYTVLQFIKEMKAKGWVLDASSYHTLINYCKYLNRPLDVLFFYDEMKRAGLKPLRATYGVVVDVMAAKGMTKETERIFEEMRKAEEDITARHINPVLKMCGKRGGKDDILVILNQMNEMKVKPNSSTYSTLMSICLTNKLYNDVFFWYNEMIDAGISPDVHNLIVLMDTYKEMGQIEKAQQIFKEAESSGIKLNAKIYNRMMTLRTDMVTDEKLNLVMNMKYRSIKPTTLTYEILILSLLSARRLAVATEYYIEMRSLNITPTNKFYSKLIWYAQKGLPVCDIIELRHQKEQFYPNKTEEPIPLK